MEGSEREGWSVKAEGNYISNLREGLPEGHAQEVTKWDDGLIVKVQVPTAEGVARQTLYGNYNTLCCLHESITFE